MRSEDTYIALVHRLDVEKARMGQTIASGRRRVATATPLDTAGDVMAEAMRERFPMLDRKKSFDLARVALAALMPYEESHA